MKPIIVAICTYTKPNRQCYMKVKRISNKQLRLSIVPKGLWEKEGGLLDTYSSNLDCGDSLPIFHQRLPILIDMLYVHTHTDRPILLFKRCNALHASYNHHVIGLKPILTESVYSNLRRRKILASVIRYTQKPSD